MICCEEYKEREVELTQQTIANSAFKKPLKKSELNSNSEIFLRLSHRDSDKEGGRPTHQFAPVLNSGGGDR